MDILEKKKKIDELLGNNFKIVMKLELFLDSLDSLICNIPRSNYYYKDKLRSDSYLLLEYIYLTNYSDDINKKTEYLCFILTKISIIDRLLGRLYYLSYISEKQLYRSITLLNEVTKMVKMWIGNVKKNC